MGDKTGIQWTDATWNPTTGCDRISPGCANCYAIDMAARLKLMGADKYQTDGNAITSGPGFGVAVHERVFDQPLRWRRPRRVFVDSMSDLAHARVPDDVVAHLWAVMTAARWHTFQVLTKRPRRLAHLLTSDRFRQQIEARLAQLPGVELGERAPWPAPNIWVGTSIELDEYVWRADALRQTPAAVRFLSCEPLLGPLPSLDLAGIDWLIVGGESGLHHRPLDLDWVRDLRDQALTSTTAFFFKQVGGRTPKAGGRLLDRRTWDETPEPVVVGQEAS